TVPSGARRSPAAGATRAADQGLSDLRAPHDRRADDVPAVRRDHADHGDTIAHVQPGILVLRHAREVDPYAWPGVSLDDHLTSAAPLHAPVDANDLLLSGRGRRNRADKARRQGKNGVRDQDAAFHHGPPHLRGSHGPADFDLSNLPDLRRVEAPGRVVAAPTA